MPGVAALSEVTSGFVAILSQRPFFPDAPYILALTAFLDAVELSFGRILWFARTFRFWLYFVLHYALSCLASYILAYRLPTWYLLGFVGTFLGVGVISNADIKVGGQSLVPIGQLFTALKARMIEQAAEDKAAEVARAILVERLQRLGRSTLEAAFRATSLAAGTDPAKIEDDLRSISKRSDTFINDFLINKVVKINQRFAEQRIATWEAGGSSS